MENKQTERLFNVSVDIVITDADSGEVATAHFSFGNATVHGQMEDTGGSEGFVLPSQAKGGLEWLFIPYSEAAPTED